MIKSVGLPLGDLAIIVTVLQQHGEVSEAYLFGSRAKGNYRNSSDVDIALKGVQINEELISDINYTLNEETSLPYHFDILNYHSITNIDLKNHIDRIGIRFYPEV